MENVASVTNWNRAGKLDWEGYTRRFLEAIVGVLKEARVRATQLLKII